MTVDATPRPPPGKSHRRGPTTSEVTKTLIRTLETVRDEAARRGVTIEQHLDLLDAARPDKAGWRTSITALLETLGCDSALKRRREIAKDLNFTGNLDAAGTLGIWLHAEVMMMLKQPTDSPLSKVG